MIQALEKLHALVVEDHSFQLDYIANCLQQIGIARTSKATDGQAGLDIIDHIEGKIDLVICDLQMPKMDGIEFIRNLAEREFKGAIIILTAMDAALVASVTKMIAEYPLNFVGALHKPVDTRHLITIVSEACATQRTPITRPLPSGVSEDDLITALDRGGLSCYYQPKFNFESGALIGIEALARLRLEDGQLVYPDDFIYLYKKLDRTQEFEIQVYAQAFQFLNRIIKRGIALQLSINFCANMLGNDTLYHSLLQLASDHKVPNDLVTVEITERSLINNMARSIEFLARLRLNGFHLAVDDFGTGYSSIKQLEVLPFNEIKVDKSFLLGIEKDPQKRAIVKTITDLAHRLGLQTVAEGIETQAAWDIAKDFGCDVCQGFLTARPMDQQSTLELINQHFGHQ